MKVLFAVSNDNITTSVVNKYQQKYKEIITSKNVYYFNAIIKELQRDKSYDAIVIGEDLEPISNNNYESIDKFLFEKLDGISDEASKPTGEDIPIIFICSDRRTQSDQLLIKLFGIGIYNAIIGNDRSIDTVCNLIYKPRNKKEAKTYYRVESEEVGLYERENDQDVSENEIQSILAHYRKIGPNVKKCVESFDSIADQYNETQLRVVINFLPNEVKSILEANSSRYQKLIKKGTVLSNGAYSQYQKQNPRVPGNLDFITKDLEKTTMSKPVIIPSSININKNTTQQMKQAPAVSQNNMQQVPNGKQNSIVQGVNRNNMQTVNNNNQLNGNNGIPNVAPKRGRGRPRKVSTTPSTISTNNTNQATGVNNAYMQNTTTPMNNPNQMQQFANAQNTATPMNHQNYMQQPTNVPNGLVSQMQDMHPLQQTENQEPKRGRGRPRKVVATQVQQQGTAMPQEQTSVAPQEVTPTPVVTPDLSPLPGLEDIEPIEPLQVPAFEPTPLQQSPAPQAPIQQTPVQQTQAQTTQAQQTTIPEANAFDDVLPGLEENDEAVDLFSMDPLDNVNENEQSTILPGFDSDIENNQTMEDSANNGANLFDLDLEENTPANTNSDSNLNDIDSLLNGEVFNASNNDINSNPYANTNMTNIDTANNVATNNINNSYQQNNISNQTQQNGNIQSNMNNPYQQNSNVQNNMSNPYQQNNNVNSYNNQNMSQDPYNMQNNNMYGESAYQSPYDAQNNTNSLTNMNQNSYTNNNVIAGNGKITAFVGTTKNGTSFIVNNLAQLLSQNGVKTAILDLTKNKNSYYMFTDNDANLMKKATDSIKNLSNGIVDGLQVNKNLTVFTSLPDESEDTNTDVILRTLSSNFEITLLDCDFNTQIEYFTSANEIYLIQSMDTFTIQPLTQFLSDLKLKNALDESKLRVVINKYVKLKRLDERLIIGGMSKYNEPSMTLQRDLFNAQTIKYVTIPFEMDTYARYLESIAMCNLSLNGYSQNFLMGLENLKNMVYPLVSGGNSYSNPQNNTEEKRGLFGGKKNKQQPVQTTQFSNNVNDTLNKMRTNNF